MTERVIRPGFTKTRNHLLDVVIPNLSRDNDDDQKFSTAVAAAILILVERQTTGYHRETAEISITDMERFIGASRSTLKRARRAVEKRGYLEVVKRGGGSQATVYRLNLSPEDKRGVEGDSDGQDIEHTITLSPQNANCADMQMPDMQDSEATPDHSQIVPESDTLAASETTNQTEMAASIPPGIVATKTVELTGPPSEAQAAPGDQEKSDRREPSTCEQDPQSRQNGDPNPTVASESPSIPGCERIAEGRPGEVIPSEDRNFRASDEGGHNGLGPPEEASAIIPEFKFKTNNNPGDNIPQKRKVAFVCRNLKKIGVEVEEGDLPFIGWILKTYGLRKIYEKITMMRYQKIRGIGIQKPLAWLRRALEKDYQFCRWDREKLKADERARRQRERAEAEARLRDAERTEWREKHDPEIANRAMAEFLAIIGEEAA